MPPTKKNDCGLILFDLKSPQKEKLLSGLIKFASLKWFSGSRDMYRLILVNSKKTENEKNYPNLFKTDVDDFVPQDILNCIEEAESAEGDWLDAFLLSIFHLKQANDLPGTTSLQLVFFTSLEKSSKLIDDIKLQKVINELNETNIFVYIIGPEVKMPCTITQPEAVKHCMKKLIVDKTNPSLVAAQKIVQETKNSVLCDINVGINLLLSFKKSRGTQPWKVPISFGTQLEIPAVTVRVFRKDQALRLSSNAPRSMKPVLVEDQTVEVAQEEIVRGISRHGRFVQMGDKEMFKIENPRCFEILGFTDMKFVPETYMRGDDTFYVLPNNELEDDSCELFYHLVNVLADQKKYGIIKKVTNANCIPKYNVLIPRPDMNPKCLVMVGLPFADDVRRHKFEAPEPSKIKQEEDFLAFLKSVDITNEQKKVDVPIGPLMMLETHAMRLVNAAANKLVRKDLQDVGIDNYLDVGGTNKLLENIRKSWPERTEDSRITNQSF
ncbi:unnamed protein product [Phaedon cochleariae]|uniref:Ku domain-containing protein n=1 Tax=Phaedon cochleariae TaxID=80249 RepID=A0A9P0DJZ1_PHACE|nr:unnamed protein product [Phaedon cochleariae]